MRLLTRSVVAWGLAALIAIPVMAQQQRGGEGFGFGSRLGAALLLSIQSVQEELKLDDAQKEKVRAIAVKARQKFDATGVELRKLDNEEQRVQKLHEINIEANTAAHRAAAEVLKPEQFKRLTQIELQTAGAIAFKEEGLQNLLKLTEAQKTDIAEIHRLAAEETRTLFPEINNDRRGVMEKIRNLRKQTLSRIEDKLTDEQKTKYRELRGAPFELRFPGQGRGGDST